MKLSLILLAAGLVATLAMSNPVGAEEDDPPARGAARFKITTRIVGDTVTVTGDKDRTVLTVTCPSGIGGADIERVEERWPKAVVLRLRLKGLEGFLVKGGKASLGASVAVRGGKPQVRTWKDGKEDAPLDAKSPFWMDIRVLGADGKPARELPLRDGYFEIPLPAALLEANPKSLHLTWVDFYRG